MLPNNGRNRQGSEEPNVFRFAPESGPAVQPVVAQVQRAFFDPPDLSRSNDVSKYRR